MPVTLDGTLFKKHKNNCTLFIETGSYAGDGINAALNAGFEKIISIELDECRYNECKKKFEGNNKVSIIFGDSRNVLNEILSSDIVKNHNIFFWLDAHRTGNNTGDGISATLFKELEAISKFLSTENIESIIMMDDMNTILENKISEISKLYSMIFLNKESSSIFENAEMTDIFILVYKKLKETHGIS